MTVTLPAIVGQQTAIELLLTGRQVGGEMARSLGLCDRLVPAEEIRAEARALAAQIAACAPLAVRWIRQTMRGDLVRGIWTATDREAAEQERLMDTRDFHEGVRAASQRRPPSFSDC